MKKQIKTLNKKAEILSPAGSIESAYAAVSSGCDAIYLGGKKFNARSSADNFDNEQIKEVIDYCHLRGVKVYITVNSIYKNTELDDLFEFLVQVYSYGADAFILQDIGTALTIKKVMPDIALHASVQMTAHSLSDVLFLENAGFSRVILSRELSITEIKNIKQNSNIELESFVHGALCVSYSGQCLMSSFIGGRSGNRGKCAQPCRLPYDLLKDDSVVKSGHLLSPKDIMTIDILDKIIDAGICCLKIEGRMKNPEYVAITTKSYSDKLNDISREKNSDADELNKKKLTQIFNRGGFSQGYYENHSGKEMMSTDSPKSAGLLLGRVKSYVPETQQCVISTQEPLIAGDGIVIRTDAKPDVGVGISKNSIAGDDVTVFLRGNIKKGDLVYKSFDKALMDETRREFEKDIRQINITANVEAKQDEKISLTLIHESTGSKSTAFGNNVERALSQPMTSKKILSQLAKTGGTPFKFNFDKVEIDDNIFIPLSELNALRRNAIDIIQEKIVSSYERKLPDIDLPLGKDISGNDNKEISVLVSNSSQFDAALDFDEGIKRIYFEMYNDIIKNIEYYINLSKQKNIEIFAALSDIDGFDNNDDIIMLEKTEITGYLVRNIGQIYKLKDLNSSKKIISDYSFNVSNRLTYDALNKYASNITLSLEINFEDINEIGSENSELIIYGKTKLMTTKQCPVGNYAANKNTGKYCKLKNNSLGYSLKDRTGVKMPIITNCDQCIAYIYSDRPIFMILKTEDLMTSSAKSLRLSFTDESRDIVKQIIDIALEAIYYDNLGNAIEKNRVFMDLPFTYGHYFKGVL